MSLYQRLRASSGMLIATLAALAPVATLAHTGVHSTNGFVSGFTHPLLGVDHLLAMLAVGMLATQLATTKRSAFIALPLSFISMMLIGSVVGMAGVSFPVVELVIALSVIVFGAAIAMNRYVGSSVSVFAAVVITGGFALFHGHAHGAEIVGGVSGVQYVAGFVFATTLLHAIGVGLTISIHQLLHANVIRLAGATMAVFGVVLLVGTMATPASAAERSTQAVDSQLCQITLVDGSTEDWNGVAPVVQEEPDSDLGTTYYWTGESWVTTEPESYTHKTNIDEMADLEEIRVCNNQKSLFVYVDTVFPMFSIYDVAHAQFIENTEVARWQDNTETVLPTNPKGFDYWAVISMQRQEGSGELYYYAIHLVAPAGINGMNHGPAVEALYKDNGNGQFNPNADEQLVVFENDSTDEWFEYRLLCDLFPDLEICFKDYNERGAIEVTMQLVNSAGRGLFTETPIQYGEVLSMSVEMIPNSQFTDRSSSATTQAVSKSQEFDYRIASAVPQNLTVSEIENRPRRMRLDWDAMTEVSEYRVRVRNANKKVIQRRVVTGKTHASLRRLKRGKEYRVQVRAKYGNSLTPWSAATTFVH